MQCSICNYITYYRARGSHGQEAVGDAVRIPYASPLRYSEECMKQAARRKRPPDPSDSLSRPPGTCCRAIALDLTGRWLRAELKTVCRSGDINCYMREVFLARKSGAKPGKYRQQADIAIVSRARSVKIFLAGDPAATISLAPQENVFPRTESGGPIGVAALAIGCAIPPKAAISIQAQCFGHSGTCRALNRGFLRCSPRLLTQSRLAPVRLLK